MAVKAREARRMHESLSLLCIGREGRNHERQLCLCHHSTSRNTWKLCTDIVTLNHLLPQACHRRGRSLTRGRAASALVRLALGSPVTAPRDTGSAQNHWGYCRHTASCIPS